MVVGAGDGQSAGLGCNVTRPGRAYLNLGTGTVSGVYAETYSHAKAYRNFAEEHRRLQAERIAAFGEYIADVKEGRFPERGHLVEMDAQLLEEVVCLTGGDAAKQKSSSE